MRDVRTTLASVRDRMHPRDDEATFESLRRLRGRRRQRQRLVAIGVATIFAIAGTAIVVRAFQPRPAAVTPSQPVSVQPTPGNTITVGPQGQTSDMVAGFGKLWIAAYGVAGGQGLSGSALVQVDPATMEIVGTTPVPEVPTWETGGGGLLATPEAIWVAAYSMKDGEQQGALYRIDPASGRVQTFTDPAVVDFKDAASDGTYLWLAAARGDRAAVVRFDPTNDTFSDPVGLSGDTARYIEAVPGEVIVSQLSWVGGQGPCVSLASIDPTRLAVLAESPLRDQVCSPDRTGLGVALFVLNGVIWSTPAGAFATVDPATAEPVQTPPSYDEMAFPRSDPIVAPTGVWYGAYPGGNGSRQDILSRFDPESNTVQAYNVEVGWSVGVALDDAIWAMGWDGTLTKIALEPGDIGTSSQAVSSPTLAGNREVIAKGSDAVVGLWSVFVDLSGTKPTYGVVLPGEQTFTTEIAPLGIQAFGAWSITSGSEDRLLLTQVVAPRVTRAEVQLDDGTVVVGRIVELPSDVIGPAGIVVVGFQSAMTVEGQHLDPNGWLVLSDSNGQEIARRRLAVK